MPTLSISMQALKCKNGFILRLVRRNSFRIRPGPSRLNAPLQFHLEKLS